MRRTNNSVWFDDGIGVVRAENAGDWRSHDVLSGSGSYLILGESVIVTDTSHRRAWGVSFQIDKDVRPGDVIDFTPIPTDRDSITLSSETNDTYTMMMPCEFTAFFRWDPDTLCMPSTSKSNARIKILNMSPDSVRVHVTMHAIVPYLFPTDEKFDLDQEFTVNRRPAIRK